MERVCVPCVKKIKGEDIDAKRTARVFLECVPCLRSEGSGGESHFGAYNIEREFIWWVSFFFPFGLCVTHTFFSFLCPSSSL